MQGLSPVQATGLDWPSVGLYAQHLEWKIKYTWYCTQCCALHKNTLHTMSHMTATNIASATSAASNIVSARTATTNIAPQWSRQKNVTRDLEPANSEASYFSAPEIISLTVTVVQKSLCIYPNFKDRA